MTYTYRQLSAADIATMRGLNRMFGDAFEDPASYHQAPPSDAYLAARLSDPHFVALVALDGTEVVGGIAAYELVKFERERSELYLYDLAVAEAHRRKGLATGLIRELQRVAKARGAYVVFVQADRGDDPAIRLYESLGTREDVHHFDIPVDPATDA